MDEPRKEIQDMAAAEPRNIIGDHLAEVAAATLDAQQEAGLAVAAATIANYPFDLRAPTEATTQAPPPPATPTPTPAATQSPTPARHDPAPVSAGPPTGWNALPGNQALVRNLEGR